MSDWSINTNIFNGYPYPFPPSKIFPMMSLPAASSWFETTSGTFLSGNISATVGKTILAIVTTRSATTLPPDWTIIDKALNFSTSSQNLYVLSRIAQNTDETFSVSQAAAGRIYIQLLAFPSVVTFETVWSYQTLDDTATVISPPGKNSLKTCILWALSANLWASASPYGKLQTTPNDIQRYSAPTDVQDRQGVFIDVGIGAINRTFPLVSSSGAGCLMFKITSDEELEIPPSEPDYAIPVEFLTVPFYYRNSPRFVWSISTEINNGYPYVFILDFHPPYHLPVVQEMALNMVQGYVGGSADLIITLSGWKYINNNDILQIFFRNSSDETVYTDDVILYDGQTNPLLITIPGNFLETIPAGLYKVQTKVFREVDNVSSGTLSIDYLVTAFPSLSVIAMTPNELAKPITAENNTVVLRYEVTGAGIEKITNTFEIASFSVTETLRNAETMAITTTAKTARVYDVSFTFNVTDPDFELHSFRFLFGDYTSVDEVDYRIDNVTVMKGNYPMNGWVEYIAPSPMPLELGSHTIRVYNSPSYWYLFSTATKPTVPGMAVTSSTVYAMEMVYSISTSGVGGERNVTLTVDDTVQPGEYPVMVESAAVLEGYGEYGFDQTTGNMLTVLEAPILDPSIGSIALSKSGRYAGYETDIEVTVSGLANVRTGDTITVSLKSGSVVLYENTGSLIQDATTYLHAIPASEFVGLIVGSYPVIAEVKRGGFSDEKSVSYSVVTAPSVSFASITPDTVQLPISTPMTITSAWTVTGSGINSIQGSIELAGTSCSANINTGNMAFNAAFANVSTLAAGLYALNVNLTLTGNEYGSVSIADTYNDSLTVLAPMPEPETGSVGFWVGGGYIGSETAVTVTASDLQNIFDGDTITVQLYQSATGFHEYTEILTAEASAFTHTMPQDKFVGLDAGDYTVRVYISRNNTIRSNKEAVYHVAALPTVQLISVSPDSIQLPIITPEAIVVTLAVSGDGMNNIAGMVGLDESAYSQTVNTTNPQITVTLENVQNLAAQGYAIAVNLTVTSSQYGTAAITALFDNTLCVLAAIVPKNHRSGNIYIYKDFELVYILKNYISFKWVRRYNKSGEFILQLVNTPANVNLIKSGNIITKDNDDEAGFIEDVTISDKIEVKGSFISKMLSYRVVNFTSETPVDLQSTAEQIIRWNYINSGSDRAIPGLRIMNNPIAPQNALVKIENGSVEQWLENQDAGFKVAFNPAESAYDFSMYDGRRSDAVFCESFKNITDQQYYRQTAGAKNVCLVEVDEEQTITIGNAQGLARREAYVRAGRYDPNELGAQFLRRNEPIESLDVKIVNPYTPFEYKQDYDVGDIVTITSQSYNITITKNILEVTEFFDRTGFHLYVVFGSIPRDLLTELQDKDNRLEVLEKLPEPKQSEELSEETIENLKDLIIPEIVDEVFEQLEFPPLPDYLSEEKLRETIETIVDGKLDGFIPPGGGTGSGDGIHVIIDYLPTTQAEIDTFPLNAEVLVYNPDNPYIPNA